MLDRDRYLTRLRELAEAIYEPDRFGNWLGTWNKSTARRDAYWKACHDMDPAIWEATCDALLLEQTRFPTIADIHRTAHTVALQTLSLPTRELAWQQARHACNAYRAELNHVTVRLSAAFHPEIRDEYAPCFTHPLIEHVMHLMGGCDTLQDGAQSYHKARFDELWKAELHASLRRVIRGQPAYNETEQACPQNPS
jgi:hypothetical protein